MSSHEEGRTPLTRRAGLYALYGWAALTGLGLLSASRVYLVYANAGRPLRVSDALQTGLLDAYAWAPMLPFAWWLVGRLPLRRGRWLAPAAIHALASVAFAALHILLFAWASSLARELRYGHAALGAAITSGFLVKFHADALLYWVLVLGVHLFRAGTRERARELEQARLQSELATARLEVLEQHLRPHFLFNALNGVSALVPHEPRTAERMLARLGDLLRRALQKRSRQEWALCEEIAFLEDYLALQKMRFGERLSVHIDIPPALRSSLVPRFLVQPLVENAIRHGIDAGDGRGRIEVRVRRTDERLQLAVIDDGPGLGARAPADQRGFGLSGARERLSWLYPGSHALEIRTRRSGGTQVQIEWPARTASEPMLLPNVSNDTAPCPSARS